jgi:hypothetical protein
MLDVGIRKLFPNTAPWVEWWTRENNLKLLCKAFSSNNLLNQMPMDTNVIESLNTVLG